MERAISTDERIRRAEEIYQRKIEHNTGTYGARVSVGNIKKNLSLFKKMFIQIAICATIYISFYTIKNSNYIFSKDFINQTKELLSYDINLEELFLGISKWIGGEESNVLSEMTNSQAQENTKQENETNITQEEEKQPMLEEIADAISEEQPLSENEEVNNSFETQSDADIIKANYSIIKPLSGTITSRFGTRNPTTPTVPTYHTGIDIAADTGTVFIAAMSGKVVQVSSEGDYGNHIKIEQDDVATLYAHCSKIYVSEGDTIIQGQELGEVGETGNATGPHLHFEIRKSERYVNPDDILEF